MGDCPMIRLTLARRVAIAENIRVIRLLSAAQPPRSYELGKLVLARVEAIADGAAVWVATDDDVNAVLALARGFAGDAAVIEGTN
jgi:hypothetical protein